MNNIAAVRLQVHLGVAEYRGYAAVKLTRLSPIDFVTRSPASLLVSRLKLEFGLVVFPMHDRHVVHNCSAKIAVIVPL